MEKMNDLLEQIIFSGETNNFADWNKTCCFNSFLFSYFQSIEK